MAEEAGLRLRRALECVIGTPATEGNAVERLRNGDEIFPAMLEAIAGAQHTVDFTTFVYWEATIGEEFAKALAERARAGVRVRVLLDAIGAVTIAKHLIDEMTDAGAYVEWFRPLDKRRPWANNHRGHRKILVIDEDVAFTGGVGIADEWRGDARSPSEWRDTHFRVRGPAVDGLQGAFSQNWAETGRPVVDVDRDRFPVREPAGSSTVQVLRGSAQTGWSDIATHVQVLLRMARQRVRIETAYFVPDDPTLELLCTTAARGVEVELLVPGPHADKRFVQVAGEAVFQDLLDAGAKVRCYQPTMLHAKVVTVDGVLASTGSANLNARSLDLDDEVNLVVIDPELVAILDADFDADVEASEAVDPASWSSRGIAQRAKEAVSGVIDRHL